MTSAANGQQALDALYWRAEILQALYWMRGEGIDADVEPVRLAQFLAVDAAEITVQLRQLEADGYLAVTSASPARYALTSRGMDEGGRSFADEFAALTHSAHYECAPGCWCHDPDRVGEPCPGRPRPGQTPPAPAGPDPAEDAPRGT